MNATLIEQLNKKWPKPAAQASAWPKSARYKKTRHQGVSSVIGGNSYRGRKAFLVAGFVVPAHRITRYLPLCMENKTSPTGFNFSDWIKNNRIIALGLGGLILVVFAVVATGQTGTTSDNQVQSPAEKLAALEIGETSPSSAAVAPYDEMLSKLQTKCPEESQTQIAGYLYEMKKLILQQRGIQTTYAQDADALYNAIPSDAAGVAKCSEISAALVATWK